MEKKYDLIVQTNFKELRLRISDVKKWVAEHECIWPSRLHLTTAINNNIYVYIDGQDAWELLEDFTEHYNVSTDGFELTDYFSNSEPPRGWSIIFICRLFILIFSLLVYPIHEKLFRKLTKININVYDRQDFTIADIVSWSITKRFIPRNQVKYIIVNG